MTYLVEHDPSDWGVVLSDYWAEGEVPYHYYEKEKLLVVNVIFVSQVWRMGTTEPLTLDNLQRAAGLVGRLHFKDLKKVRISFSEFWPIRRMYNG
jgi:hypothetical protein